MKQQHCLPISGPLDTFCCGCNKKYFEYKHSTVKIFATTRPVAVAARHWTGVSSYSSFTADRRGKYFSRNIISPIIKKLLWKTVSHPISESQHIPEVAWLSSLTRTSVGRMCCVLWAFLRLYFHYLDLNIEHAQKQSAIIINQFLGAGVRLPVISTRLNQGQGAASSG